MFMLKSTHEAAIKRLIDTNTRLEQRLANEREQARKTGRLATELLAERDALQAKIDRMTSGLSQNRKKPKPTNGADAHAH